MLNFKNPNRMISYRYLGNEYEASSSCFRNDESTVSQCLWQAPSREHCGFLWTVYIVQIVTSTFETDLFAVVIPLIVPAFLTPCLPPGQHIQSGRNHR